MAASAPDFRAVERELRDILTGGLLPFWLDRGTDSECGGYLTTIDEGGRVNPAVSKQLVTQTRMLWGFSGLQPFCRPADATRMERAARQGWAFLRRCFWDGANGGFLWETDRAGAAIDGGKLVYGQSFAIYALSEYYLRYGDESALDCAKRTFDLLQVYAADTGNGGYFENLEPDWTLSAGGACAGDRKSLDIHMHLMESFTSLYRATGLEIHRRKLLEVMDVIVTRMVDRDAGYGRNQFSADFRRLPAINIRRTWNADRETGQQLAEPADTTSYGHNVELSWLLLRACEALDLPPDAYAPVPQRLLDHSLKYGYDTEYGGVYRDGIANEPAAVTDKEWWQNFEALFGYLNGYRYYSGEPYLEAFFETWAFIRRHFLIAEWGESRQLLDRRGNPLVPGIGNKWKCIYHTGRALAECLNTIEYLKEQQQPKREDTQW